MNLGGIQKNSFIDYPGKISCVLFTAGCNFHCPYCHNPQLVNCSRSQDTGIPVESAVKFLADHRGLIEGVVISGGEPTLDAEVGGLCRAAKEMGYAVKLDTNGSRPRVLKRLIDDGLVDYLAMDIKADPFCYAPYIKEDPDPAKILCSIALIMDSGLPYEFRTTCVSPIVDEKGIERIAKAIAGARLYFLQRVRGLRTVLAPGFFRDLGRPHDEKALKEFRAIATPWVGSCVIR